MPSKKNANKKQAASASTTMADTDIPLAQPAPAAQVARTGPTLMEIAEERRRQLMQSRQPSSTSTTTALPKGAIPVLRAHQSPKVAKNGGVGDDGLEDEAEEKKEEEEQQEDSGGMAAAAADTAFMAATLTVLHFTFDVLVQHQYRQTLDWREIWARTAKTFPFIFAILFIFRRITALPPASSDAQHISSVSVTTSSQQQQQQQQSLQQGKKEEPADIQPPTTIIKKNKSRKEKRRQLQSALQQGLLFLLATAAGCYLVHATNTQPYFAVMKRAPPVATLWVWSVVELRVELAAMSLLAATAYLWFAGYGVF